MKSLHGNDALHMAVRMKDHYLLYMLLHLGAGKVMKIIKSKYLIHNTITNYSNIIIP